MKKKIDYSMPIEWERYITDSKYGLEMIPATLYSISFYFSETTERLTFFDKVGHITHTNMYTEGMLPNPCSFLVQNIRINGVTSAIQFGACQLIIGNKHYGVNPAWTYSLKEKGYKVYPNLLIGPLVNFQFQIQWEKPEKIGNGASGLEILVKPIQVVMYGQMARAIC